MKSRALITMLYLLSKGVCSRVQNCEDLQTFSERHGEKIPLNGIEFNLKSQNFIGEGSYGQVYVINWAEHIAAVKRIRVHDNPYHLSLLEKEIMFSFDVNGLRIAPTLFACLETNEYIYVIQELMYNDLDSKEVKETLKSFSRVERLRKYKELAMQYHTLHRQQITHQDIKPANIMAIDENLTEFRIIDFGLSQTVGNIVEGGTCTFNTVDKNKGFPRADYYHDIYAFAISLVILEENKDHTLKDLPQNCYDRLDKDATCEDEQIEYIKETLKYTEIPELESIILKAIDKDRTYQSMELLADDIEDLADRLDKVDPPKEKTNRKSQREILDDTKKELAELLKINFDSEEKEIEVRDKSKSLIDSFKSAFRDREERSKDSSSPRNRFYRKGLNDVADSQEQNDVNNSLRFKRTTQNNQVFKVESHNETFTDDLKYIPLPKKKENERII